MHADILIVGQGVAGTLLGWEFERTGVSFEIADRGPAHAATAAAAGIINPITGRRLVRSWRIETLLPAARAAYRELEAWLDTPLWREMHVRRMFADARERAVAEQKHARGELAPFVTAIDERGLWIRDAARVDLPALIATARARWLAAGVLRERAVEPSRERPAHAIVIDCRGLATAESAAFSFVPWEFSKGEMLELDVAGLDPDVILNRRQWVLPIDAHRAWCGATHEPGVRNPDSTVAGRAALTPAAQEIIGAAHPFTVVGQRGGIRVTLPDKRPVAGRHPTEARLGVINALGAKGAAWAPLLARQWLDHLMAGAPFDPELDVRRFAGGGSTETR